MRLPNDQSLAHQIDVPLPLAQAPAGSSPFHARERHPRQPKQPSHRPPMLSIRRIKRALLVLPCLVVTGLTSCEELWYGPYPVEREHSEREYPEREYPFSNSPSGNANPSPQPMASPPPASSPVPANLTDRTYRRYPEITTEEQAEAKMAELNERAEAESQKSGHKREIVESLYEDHQRLEATYKALREEQATQKDISKSLRNDILRLKEEITRMFLDLKD